MIIICGTCVKNDGFFFIFLSLIFQVVRVVKGQKIAQNVK